MIAHLIAALIGNYMTTCFVIGLLVAGVQILRYPGHRSAAVISGRLLDTFLFWAVGVAQAVNFVMHSVFGEFAAKTIGWAQSPFQLELAFSSLGIAVMAFMLHGRRSELRGKAALIIATAIFAYGAAGGHVYQLVVHHDHAVNNGGLLLFMDIFIATVGLTLLIWHTVARRQDVVAPAASDDAPAALQSTGQGPRQ